MYTNGLGRADTLAISATNAFRMARVFGDVDIHLAGLAALAALNALVLVDSVMQKRNLIKQGVEGT